MAPQSRLRSFPQFLDQVYSRPENERWPLVEEFMSHVESTPLIEEETHVHFLFRGDAANVTVPCDANEWSPSGFQLKHIPGTDLWHYSHQFEPDARLDYKLLLNGAHWMLDPRNPHRIEGGYGYNSELRMPKYSPQPETVFHPAIPHGSIITGEIVSKVLAGTRSFNIYLPAGYELNTASYPLVLVHDGMEFLSLGKADHILDYLIARRRMAPVVGLFLSALNRNAEYSGPQMGGFHSFVVEELLPHIERRYRVLTQPSHRASIGASNGGNISLWLGVSYPETFGHIGALSSNVVTAVMNAYEDSPRLNLQFYLDVGSYDLADIIPKVKCFIDLLRAKGYPYVYRKNHDGHSWGNWSAHLGRVLRYFFPPLLQGIGYPQLRNRTKAEENHPVHFPATDHPTAPGKR